MCICILMVHIQSVFVCGSNNVAGVFETNKFVDCLELLALEYII